MDKFIDAHCHYNSLNFFAYSGAGEFICNAASEDDWKPLLAVSRCDKRIFAAIGIHPWHADGGRPGWDDRLRDKLRQNPNIMVGEIGLDRMRPYFDRQISVFVAQMEIAAELNRTVHIHCVRAWDVMLRLLKTVRHPRHIVMHRFAGGSDVMRALIKMFGDDIFFSYRAPLNERAQHAVAATPEKQILVETDGDRPAPENIMDATVQIAACLHMPSGLVRDIVYNNTLRMIKNGQIE